MDVTYSLTLLSFQIKATPKNAHRNQSLTVRHEGSCTTQTMVIVGYQVTLSILNLLQVIPTQYHGGARLGTPLDGKEPKVLNHPLNHPPGYKNLKVLMETVLCNAKIMARYI